MRQAEIFGENMILRRTVETVYGSNEILFHDEMCEELDNGRISRINGTDYVLVEFMPSDPYQYIRNSLDEIMSEGYQPVIAHVEGYDVWLMTLRMSGDSAAWG